MEHYLNIDLCLDTFPYNGVTTTFESLWMGVPVITMNGFNFNSRCGESINKNIQMNNLIAQNEEEYISIATNLSNNKKQLDQIKRLSDKNTFTVTTGHQLNLFTGPLYFFYKIIMYDLYLYYVLILSNIYSNLKIQKILMYLVLIVIPNH